MLKFGDARYARGGLPDWVKSSFGWIMPTVLRPIGVQGFVVVPKRPIVEHTFAWLARYRRHARDDGKTTASSEAIAYIALIALMSTRLAQPET